MNHTHEYRVEVRNPYNGTRRILTNVEQGWSIEGNVNATIRWSGKMTLRLIDNTMNLTYADTATGLTWFHALICPFITVDGVDHQLGAFRAKPSTGTVTPGSATLELSLVDITSVFAEYLTDSMTVVGTDHVPNVTSQDALEITQEIIHNAEKLPPYGITVTPPPDPLKPFTRSLIYSEATSYLTIINEVLQAVNYFALYTNYQGQLVLTPYKPPEARPIVYTFASHSEAIHIRNYSWEQDLDIPNHVIAYSREDSEHPRMRAEARNNNPGSPWSVSSQGRVVTRVLEPIEVQDQGMLNAYAQRMLRESSRSAITFQREMLFHPGIELNAVCADSDGRREVVEKIAITATPGTLIRIETRRVEGGEGE